MTEVLRTNAYRARAARLLAGAVVLLAAACGSAEPAGSPASPVSDVAAPTVLRAPEPDVAVAAPQGKPLLTMTGRIGATNADGALELDRAELDRLGQLALTVNDPWAHQRVPLQGVWLRDLVALAKPEAGATTLHLRALDDYQVDLPLADVRDRGVLLATRTGAGADLPVEDGGPTRVVFSDDASPAVSPDLWIWNIESIEVR